MSFYLIYIDPGTGSLIAQAVLAGFIAGLVFLKNKFKKIFHLFKKEDTQQTNKT